MRLNMRWDTQDGEALCSCYGYRSEASRWGSIQGSVSGVLVLV
jgi:hypothetical protein